MYAIHVMLEHYYEYPWMHNNKVDYSRPICIAHKLMITST